MQLIATKDLRYASRDLKAGERFEASATDANILKATGKAEEAGTADDGLFDRAAGKGRSRYRRSDMRAED